jgi:hypothetical protein
MLDKTVIKSEEKLSRTVVIAPPKMQTALFKLVSTSPLIAHRFSQKARLAMQAKQEAGSTGNSKKPVREKRDLKADFEAATYFAEKGWAGFPASAFRTGMISSCRLVGFKMTLAKLSVFIEPDGFDKFDGTPLVRINGNREQHVAAMRNDNGSMDLRSRPMWREWSIDLRVKFDADQFTLEDVSNLLLRVGMQVGVGEGRPDSRNSPGAGFGLFTISEKKGASK